MKTTKHAPYLVCIYVYHMVLGGRCYEIIVLLNCVKNCDF